MRWGLVCIVAMIGCLSAGDVPCGDRICPSNTICEPTTSTCLTQEQVAACAGIADDEACSGPDFVGICTNSACVPACGDGAIDRDVEECDDGNFRSRDGCSSQCSIETMAWEQMANPWTGMLGHLAGYAWSTSTLEVLAGESQAGLRTQQWEADAALTTWDDVTPSVMPSPRKGAAMAYFGARISGSSGKLVLFGGTDATGTLGDTWEWRGAAGWQKLTPATSPLPREGAQMVYDITHGRIVMFGGFNSSGFLTDTWEYDGTTWIQRTTANVPSGRVHHGMAYDEGRDVTVMYGGAIFGLFALADHWEYDNGAWTQIGPASTPPPGKRNGPMLGYAPDRKIVLFGGFTESAEGGFETNDTWKYDGASWTQVATIQAPPARSRGTLTLTPKPTGAPADQLILIGGEQADGKPALDDVWRLTPNGWIEITPHFQPPSRQGAPAVYDDRTQAIHIFGGAGTIARSDVWTYLDGMWAEQPASAFPTRFFHTAAYDPARDRVVMFGGFDIGFTITNDTYESAADATFAWMLRAPAVRPPARLGGVLAWDGVALVLFGGSISNNQPADDTWTYDGTTWTHEAKTGDWPAASTRAAAAYDPVHDRLVLFDRAGVTWTHRGGTWTKLDTPRAPSARDDGAMTFDWQTSRLVLTGGRNAQELFTDVWELYDTSWSEVTTQPGGPLPRAVFGFASTPRSRQTLLIGGTATGGQPASDIWSLGYQPVDADEICDNGRDDDADRHIDIDDPDCCRLDVERCLTR